MPEPRLFLIDDDREYCADLEAVLGGGFSIFQAHSGGSALEMMDRVGPDVILLDVDFGDENMSGLEILERVRAQENPPPVIMLSGSQSLSTVVRAMKMGAFHYIAKPADVPELINLINQALASSQRGRQIQAQRGDFTTGPAPFNQAKNLMVRHWETRYVAGRLTETAGNVTRAAELSGMSRQGFQRKMRELGLRSRDFQT